MVSAVTKVIRRVSLVVTPLKTSVEVVKMVLDRWIIRYIDRRHSSVAVVAIDQPQPLPIHMEASDIPAPDNWFKDFRRLRIEGNQLFFSLVIDDESFVKPRGYSAINGIMRCM